MDPPFQAYSVEPMISSCQLGFHSRNTESVNCKTREGEQESMVTAGPIISILLSSYHNRPAFSLGIFYIFAVSVLFNA
ncbi:hypothetical protein BDV27DRAFT_66166 [Aspergillus caelatus]|uniref:Uncharacterized protein n=1 Tax=Aspergillus caelatus TaxID=61420 RepID=A0A5N6ZMK6_9EURO|nr:uncharacterized protein BDV27DRAFT_66166 [Aspergillus caelatus]KAE8358618.1 hypothetical protein BDV27DRAFT_66166 [Aspergillus caelatus]